MQIQLQSNLEEVAAEIERLAEPKDRAAMYADLTSAAARHLIRKLKVPNAFFDDKTGHLRNNIKLRRGNLRFHTSIQFNSPHAHLVDAGNKYWEGTDFVSRLWNENRNSTLRAAVSAAPNAWRKFGRRLERQIKKQRLKVI